MEFNLAFTMIIGDQIPYDDIKWECFSLDILHANLYVLINVKRFIIQYLEVLIANHLTLF